MYTYIRHCGLCPTKLKLGPPRPNSTEQFDSPFETGSLQSILGTVLNIDIIYIYIHINQVSSTGSKAGQLQNSALGLFCLFWTAI